MNTRKIALVLVLFLFGNLGIAQESEPYQVPMNEHGQPDLQGVWSTRWNTMLERPPGMPLVLPPEAAQEFAQAVYEGGLSGNTDPDIDILGPQTLAMVKGEYRSSVIVYPEDGSLPYNQLGIENSSFEYFKGDFGFDGPEDRPGVERCIEAWGSPPLRVIHMDGATRPDAIRTFEGHSIGRWEGDSLVVETTHYSDTNPERASMGRPMLISSEAHVSERFTRLSDTELFYEYTVNDPVYYTEAFRGEFSFTRDEPGHIYEYSCHEGNYSMEGALRGARYQEAQEREASN